MKKSLRVWYFSKPSDEIESGLSFGNILKNVVLVPADDFTSSSRSINI